MCSVDVVGLQWVWIRWGVVEGKIWLVELGAVEHNVFDVGRVVCEGRREGAGVEMDEGFWGRCFFAEEEGARDVCGDVDGLDCMGNL